jgi:pectinesterase inhibitor-like protein
MFCHLPFLQVFGIKRYSQMAFTCKFVIVLAAIFMGLIAYVSGDATIINNVCSKTTVANYCHRCFGMYSRSSHEDVKALGRTSIDCASQQSLNTMELEGKFVVNANNKAVKNAYLDCALKLHSGDQMITTALQSWQNARYADAGNQMLAAQQAVRDCSAALQKFNPSPALVVELTTLQGFCQAADGVLKQIK